MPLSLIGKHLRNPIQSQLLAEFRNLVAKSSDFPKPLKIVIVNLKKETARGKCTSNNKKK